MKLLLTAALLALLPILPPVPREAPKSQNSKEYAYADYSQNNKIPTAQRAVIPSQNNQSATSHSAQGHGQANEENDPPSRITVEPVSLTKDRWDYAYIAATLVIACVTMILAIIAKMSADIATNAQRSWIVNTGIDKPDFGNQWIQHIPVHFKVIGSSPVRVTESNFRVRTVPAKVVDERSDKRQPDLPERPDYKDPATLEDSPEMGGIRAPGEEFSVVPMLESLFLMEGGGEHGGGEDVKAVRNREKFLCVYGFVRYRDAFSRSKIRETRFCYVYHVPQPIAFRMTEGWNIGGPPMYNEAT